MADEKRKHRTVQPTALEWSRYLVLDKCLRNRNRYYHLEDLVDAENDVASDAMGLPHDKL